MEKENEWEKSYVHGKRKQENERGRKREHESKGKFKSTEKI